MKHDTQQDKEMHAAFEAKRKRLKLGMEAAIKESIKTWIEKRRKKYE